MPIPPKSPLWKTWKIRNGFAASKQCDLAQWNGGVCLNWTESGEQLKEFQFWDSKDAVPVSFIDGNYSTEWGWIGSVETEALRRNFLNDFRHPDVNLAYVTLRRIRHTIKVTTARVPNRKQLTLFVFRQTMKYCLWGSFQKITEKQKRNKFGTEIGRGLSEAFSSFNKLTKIYSFHVWIIDPRQSLLRAYFWIWNNFTYRLPPPTSHNFPSENKHWDGRKFIVSEQGFADHPT